MQEFVVKNAFTKEILGHHSFLSLKVAKEKIRQVKKSQQTWKNLTVQDRVRAIQKGLTYFEDKREEITTCISQEMGKPIQEAIAELNSFFQRANYLCEIAQGALSTEVLNSNPGDDRYIEHRPLGTVLVIATWNYPLLVPASGIITALLCGNGVILKHSRLTPSVGEYFEQAFGMQSILQNLQLTHEATLELIEQGEVDHVVFTGSNAGGKKIYQAVSRAMIDCNLELGGKDGAYVAADADLEKSVRKLVKGAMYNAGQSCCSIERVYVHQDIIQPFLEAAAKEIGELQLGDPCSPSTTMGPLAQEKQLPFLQAQIQDAKQRGAKIICGGQQVKLKKGFFWEPTLLTDVNHSMKVMMEESFGPLLPVMSVRDDAEGFSMIKDSDYGLSASIFTTDKAKALNFCSQIEVGTLFMNQCDYLDPALPWTGYKKSGKGSSLSRYGFYALTKLKSLSFKLF